MSSTPKITELRTDSTGIYRIGIWAQIACYKSDVRISATPDEVKSGTKTGRWSKKTEELEFAALRNQVIALSTPVTLNDKRVTVIMPTRFDRIADKKQELDFIPIWQRTWIVCHSRSNKIRLIVLELEDRKLQFDGEGVQPCSYSTQGDGVGQAADEEAEELLPKLINERPARDFVNEVVLYLAKSVADLKPAVAK